IDNIISCSYSSEEITHGHLLGKVDSRGNIQMSYHQINTQGALMNGICSSKPELLDNGKIRLLEEWQWTSGDKSKGRSILEEV
ncbi:MAG: n-acetylglutamate synthase, partial [Vicingaceae bacterium]|nr:n-acetylglutamate synthase [Vicingaceae bacterium]